MHRRTLNRPEASVCSENGGQAEAGISRDRDTSFEFYPCEVSRGESWSEYIINLFYIWDTSEGGGGPSGSGGGAVRCLSQCQCRARGSPGPSSPRGSSSRADGVICPAFVAWRGRGRGGRRGGGGDGPSDGCESDRLLLRRVPDEMDIASPDFSVSSEMGRQPFNSIAA